MGPFPWSEASLRPKARGLRLAAGAGEADDLWLVSFDGRALFAKIQSKKKYIYFIQNHEWFQLYKGSYDELQVGRFEIDGRTTMLSHLITELGQRIGGRHTYPKRYRHAKPVPWWQSKGQLCWSMEPSLLALAPDARRCLWAPLPGLGGAGPRSILTSLYTMILED